MNVHELIESLEEVQRLYGDIPVTYVDNEEGAIDVGQVDVVDRTKLEFVEGFWKRFADGDQVELS